MRFVFAAAAVASLLVTARASARETAAEDDEREAVDDEILGPPGNLRTRADRVSFDVRGRSLELSGDVRMDSPPFHLRSERIRVTRTRYGVEIEGDGKIAFCPCLGTPLTVEFDHAIVAPPGELILRNPKLEVYGVPVLYLPYFWMRSDDKPGLLPPDLAYRGQDGFFAGGGVHLPWRTGAFKRALDLRGGAYLLSGFAVDARLRTEHSTTVVRYDRLPGAPSPPLPLGRSAGGGADDGLRIDARGAQTSPEAGVSWDVDVLRGRRGVAATTDLDTAAKPFDRASAEAVVGLGPFTASTGIRSVTRRGGAVSDVESAGPVAALRTSGSIGSHVTYDATVEGGVLRLGGASASFESTRPPALGADALSFVRGEIGALATRAFGPLEASVTARAAGDVGREGRRSGDDRAASARARVGVPLVRAYAPSEGSPNDAWRHVLEPFFEGAVVDGRGNGILGARPGRGALVLGGAATVVHAGVATALGRWGRRDAVEASVSAGLAPSARAVSLAASRDGERARWLLRGRAASSLSWLRVSADGAAVESEGGGAAGGVVVARGSVGPEDGLRVSSNVATRAGVDPVLARLLADAPLEPGTGFLAAGGTTGGAGLVVPWSRHFTTSAGMDADLARRELVAARAGIELRDRCHCVTLRANGARRIGRSGVDVWIAVDFAADR